MFAEKLSPRIVARDLTAGLVVYLVALPLCLGVALASNAPMTSGLLAGILGGLIVGLLSGSHSSVAGPAAGLTAVVAGQIGNLGSFEAFLVAVTLSGIIQIALGALKMGSIASFFPSAVIKGLLAAIGVILILKQIPHLFGHDADVEGEMQFQQPDDRNTFSELFEILPDMHGGAALIGILGVVILLLWSRIKVLKESPIPAPLIVVVMGVALNELFAGGPWQVRGDHLVQVPRASSMEELTTLMAFPDWSVLSNPAVYTAAFTIAIVASLETLLNLDAVDQLDPQQRHSPPNRELIAQGAANAIAGLVGALPMTSVIVRSSVNLQAGARTRISAIFHGVLLFGSVLLIPDLINRIPLSALAAILFVTGFKLASAKLFKQMWSEGRQQFLPFISTVGIIVLTDLLTGVLAGLGIATAFILHSNLRRPLRRFVERHVGGEVLRIELASQVSFFNRAALQATLHEVPRGGHVLIDARMTDYIAPDILDLLNDFRDITAPAHGVEVSFLGFKDAYPELADRVRFVDYSTREVRSSLTPDAILQLLKHGNERFRTGELLTRDLVRQLDAAADVQTPMAVVLSCMDSRAPVELLFDLGIGDIFSVRIAGNVAKQKVLGSMEYGCAIAGAKLLVVMGHTSCGAVGSAVDLFARKQTAAEATGCEHLDVLVEEIQRAIPVAADHVPSGTDSRREFVDLVAERNVARTIDVIRRQSDTIERLLQQGEIKIVGALYNVGTGEVSFMEPPIEAGDPRNEPGTHSSPSMPAA